MFELLLESILAGVMTFIIGTIIFNLSINKSNQSNPQPDTINIAFFMTGVVLNLFLSLTGFNKWYCDKDCKEN